VTNSNPAALALAVHYLHIGSDAAAFAILQQYGLAAVPMDILIAVAERSIAAGYAEQGERCLRALIEEPAADGETLSKAFAIAERLNDPELILDLAVGMPEDDPKTARCWVELVKVGVAIGSTEVTERALTEALSRPIGSDEIGQILATVDLCRRPSLLLEVHGAIAQLGGLRALTPQVRLAFLRAAAQAPIDVDVAAQTRSEITISGFTQFAEVLDIMRIAAPEEARRLVDEHLDAALPQIDIPALSSLSKLTPEVLDDTALVKVLERIATVSVPGHKPPNMQILFSLDSRREGSEGFSARIWAFVMNWLASNHQHAWLTRYIFDRLAKWGYATAKAPADPASPAWAAIPESRRKLMQARLSAEAGDFHTSRLLLSEVVVAGLGRQDASDARNQLVNAYPLPVGMFMASNHIDAAFSPAKIDRAEDDLMPPPGSRVLIICERGANTAPMLSTRGRGYAITLCAMDGSIAAAEGDSSIEYWSLRDLFPDSDPQTTAFYIAGQRIASFLTTGYLELRKQIRFSLHMDLYHRVLSVTLEDGIMGGIVTAGCFRRAIERFEGEHVVIAQASGTTVEYFGPSLLSSPRHKFYLNTTGRKASAICERLLQNYEQWSPARKPSETRASDESAAKKAMAALVASHEEWHFVPPKALLKATTRPRVFFLGAFGDEIYRGNILPIIEELLNSYEVYVFAPADYEHCVTALQKLFASDTDNIAGGHLHVINLEKEFSTAAAYDGLAAKDVASYLISEFVSEENLVVGGFNLEHYLKVVLPRLLMGTCRRTELCIKYFEQLLNAVEVQALYACSERLPYVMAAVEVANKYNVKTIEIMAVNSIRLPRYKTPKATFVTSIDTITAEYYRSFFGLPDKRIVVTGSARLDIMLKRYGQADASAVRRMLDIPDDGKVALIASQMQPIERCVEILEAVLRAVPSVDNLWVVVKLHRRESMTRREIYKQKIRELSLESRVRLVFDEPVLRDIESCLKIADVVVSMYSNVLREAACVGIPVIVANFFDSELPFDFFSSGIGLEADRKEKLTETVIDVVTGNIDPDYLLRKRRFFEENPQLISGNAAKRIAELALR
jgi:glycosyltransferase involved in cell wall biosynthesis